MEKKKPKSTTSRMAKIRKSALEAMRRTDRELRQRSSAYYTRGTTTKRTARSVFFTVG